MEMAIDCEDFDFEIFEDDNFTPVKKKARRLCPQCSSEVTDRPNKIFCIPNCRKRHSEPTRNSYSTPTKRRENRDFDRALRLGEQHYGLPPIQRLGFIKDLIDHARLGEDRQLQDILSDYVLLHPHPYIDKHLFHRRNREYWTIAQLAVVC